MHNPIIHLFDIRGVALLLGLLVGGSGLILNFEPSYPLPDEDFAVTVKPRRTQWVDHHVKIWPKKADQDLYRVIAYDWRPDCISESGGQRAVVALAHVNAARRAVLVLKSRPEALRHVWQARKIAISELKGTRQSMEIITGVAEIYRMVRAYGQEAICREYLSQQARRWTGPTSGYTFTHDLMLANALYNADRRCDAEQRYTQVMQMPLCHKHEEILDHVIKSWAVGFIQHKHEHTANCAPKIHAIPWSEYLVTAERFCSLGKYDLAESQLELATQAVSKTTDLTARQKRQALKAIKQAHNNFAIAHF